MGYDNEEAGALLLTVVLIYVLTVSTILITLGVLSVIYGW